MKKTLYTPASRISRAQLYAPEKKQSYTISWRALLLYTIALTALLTSFTFFATEIPYSMATSMQKETVENFWQHLFSKSTKVITCNKKHCENGQEKIKVS